MKSLVLFGGTGGIGKKLVPFLEKKYNVIVLGSKDVDITNLRDVQHFFEINNADVVLNLSVKSYDTYVSKINAANHQLITDMVDVNIHGNINIISSCLPKMIKRGWGRIIVMSSVLSTMNVPKTAMYSASKAFVDRFIAITNKENVKFGVTCNTIQLGYFGEGLCSVIDENQQSVIKNSIGLQRWGRMEELYNTVDYIIENEYVCGTNIRIDGGL